MSISISIKSEIDSRVILYPLMRCIKPLGNCLVITSNKQVTRLVDGDYEGDFRNFHVMVDVDGGTDELLKDASISPEDYTYVIYDNVGVVEQDVLIIPIGPIVSEIFESDMMYLGEDKNTHIIRFGKPIKSKPVKTPRPPKPVKEKRVKGSPVVEDVVDDSTDNSPLLITVPAPKEKFKSKKPVKVAMTDDEIDEAVKLKFQTKKVDVSEKLKKLRNLNFPNFDDLELLESNKQFFNVDKNFVKFFFTVFQENIGITEPNFMREVTSRDESSRSF